MKKVRAAIVGYGNIGHYVLEALQAAPDFEIAGVVRRAGAENCPAELSAYPVVKNIKELKGVDVAILCTPTRKVEEYALLNQKGRSFFLSTTSESIQKHLLWN